MLERSGDRGVRLRIRTNCSRCSLSYLSHILISLHDSLNAGNGKLGSHVDCECWIDVGCLRLLGLGWE